MAAFPSKRVFTLVSCVAVAGAIVTTAEGAFAACPEADPGPLPYQNAKQAAACTKADIDFFKTEANKADATFTSLETALKAQNAACGACVFSKEDDAQWGPIVYVGTEGGAFVNWGSCFEKAPGGSAACGQTLQKAELCASLRCPEGTGFCADANQKNACLDNVFGSATSCGQYDVQTDCPNIAQLDQSCADIFAVINVVCGGQTGTVKDAGADPDDGNSSGSSGKNSSGGTDDDDEPSGSSGTSSSGGSKKKDSGASAEATPTPTTTTTVDGCAQGSSSAGGSIMSGLVVAAAVGAAVSRRRRKS